ncbi:DUF2306 domain-containing protein [Tellurirhabdus rosea]|uniref:DUF2306 domain-containing protein n=1 Tax=Tellurirhabdus rosea TaxID=2674997 RepID=UPI002257AC58|nr:DUF2306 domain-containing protein [Tellurirhabdus rosea]
MKMLISFLLITHVVAGTLALLIGLVPMFARKGSRLHNRAGRIYVWSMTYIALSSVLLCVLQPFTLFRLFLSGIAVFSFYLSTTGWRATRQKRGQITAFDRVLTYGTLLVSAGMIGFGFWLLAQSYSYLNVLFLVFGGMTGTFALKDALRYRQPAEKMAWYFQHLTRMGGSYISAITAFLVNNNTRMLPPGTPDWVHLATWIVPSVVGGILIGRTVRYYKEKFDRKPALA